MPNTISLECVQGEVNNMIIPSPSPSTGLIIFQGELNQSFSRHPPDNSTTFYTLAQAGLACWQFREIWLRKQKTPSNGEMIKLQRFLWRSPLGAPGLSYKICYSIWDRVLSERNRNGSGKWVGTKVNFVMTELKKWFFFRAATLRHRILRINAWIEEKNKFSWQNLKNYQKKT